MINVIGRVDLSAASGATVWHRASALGKLLLTGCMLGLTVFTGSPRLLIALPHSFRRLTHGTSVATTASGRRAGQSLLIPEPCIG